MGFNVEERREYMRNYYHDNKHKWINYYHTVVLPKYIEARKNKDITFKKINKPIILTFD